jgi:hypothetical protein
MITHRILALLAVLSLGVAVRVAAQSSGAANPALIGQPTALVVQPAVVELVGPRALRQLVVTARYADGSARDLTQACLITSAMPAVATVTPDGRIVPHQNGTTTLVIRAGGHTVQVAVTVRDLDKEQPISFRHEVIAALNVGGCNAGACHGTPAGKNGFRLSLRGYDPDADYVQLTHDALGRRTGSAEPEQNLILLKALGRIAHEGGARFPASSVPARVLRIWLAQGLPDDGAGLPAVKRLEILPGTQVLSAPARRQQLAVLAHFSDGSVRDVTPLTVFSSSDDMVASVAVGGLVDFHKTGEVAILCRYLETMQTVLLAYLEPKPGFVWKQPPEHNYVDKHVFAKLKMLSIPPSELCSDHEFIRRAYLDVCAVLPTPAEVKAFLADQDRDKRARLIDKLLDRPEYADFWALKWSDVLRISRKTLGADGANLFHKWLHDHIRQNTPFNKVVHGLLTADGNTFTQGPANYYRVVKQPEDLAETTAQLFLGIRLGCARCHNHPFEKWTQDDYYSTAAFFARVQVKAEKKSTPKKIEAASVYVELKGEVMHPRTGAVVPPRFLGGKLPVLGPEQDRREVFADWLTAPDNPFFARAVVNRLWFHLFGRGIVDAPDDIRDSNPPANEALLDALAKDFIAHDFDVKHILRVILNSRTYQLSATSNPFNKEDTRYFSHVVPKMLTAEQLMDAISQVTEVPEKIPGMPPGTRVVQVPDFDEAPVFLNAISRPARTLPCECERDDEVTLAKALQFVNGSTIMDKISNDKNCLTRLLASKKTNEEIATELFLMVLGREPTTDNLRAVVEHVQKHAAHPRQGWEDVLWALMNTREFMFRH